MYHKAGEPLFYLPWQRGYRHPTGDTAIDIQPIGVYTPNEGDPLWEMLPDLDNPVEESDYYIDDEVAAYVPRMPSKPLQRILVRPVPIIKPTPPPIKLEGKKGGIVL